MVGQYYSHASYLITAVLGRKLLLVGLMVTASRESLDLVNNIITTPELYVNTSHSWQMRAIFLIHNTLYISNLLDYSIDWWPAISTRAGLGFHRWYTYRVLRVYMYSHVQVEQSFIWHSKCANDSSTKMPGSFLSQNLIRTLRALCLDAALNVL